MSEKRYPELDALRGLAVLLMVVYHACFDLAAYYGFPWSVGTGGWRLFSQLTAFLFLMLVGICFVISWERAIGQNRVKKYARRAVIIFSGGMIVTLVTWILDPRTFVVFGILHLIAVATIFQILARPLRAWNFALGLAVFGTIFFLPTGSISTPFLLPFGIMQYGFFSVDYYPLLPWLGPIFIGMALSDLLYGSERSHVLSFFDRIRWPKWLLWCGRKALFIYFAHQPVILLLLWFTLGR